VSGLTASEGRSYLSNKWLALLVTLMAPFMAYVDISIVFVATPSIQHGLRASSEQIQFVVAGYTTAYAVNLITAGRLGDTYGRKRMFMIGMAGFTITSAVCAFAQDPLTLIITRVFQGAAAALMFPQALSIIQATFTSKQKNTAIALYGATIGIAGAAGQLLGGFLVQTNLFNLDWRLIFLVNVPIGLGTLIAALLIVHESKSDRPIQLDIGGAAIISVTLFLLLYPLIEGRNAGWPLWMYAAVVVSIILIIPFIFFEKRLSSSSSLSKCNHNNSSSKNGKRSHSTSRLLLPLIPLSLFNDRIFIIGTSIIILFYIGNPVFTFVLTFYLQNGLGFSPVTSGLTYLPLAIGFLISSLLTPKIVPKLKTRILKIGAIVIIIGYALLIITAHQEGSNIGLQWSQLLPYMFVVGIGLGFAIVHLINVILSRVKIEDAGAASGVLNTMIAVGNAMGIAFIGSIFFGLVGTTGSSTTATTDIVSHYNESNNHVRIHHYTDAFVSSTLCTMGLVIATFVLIFFLPSSSSSPIRRMVD
jgi:MFS family permease